MTLLGDCPYYSHYFLINHTKLVVIRASLDCICWNTQCGANISPIKLYGHSGGWLYVISALFQTLYEYFYCTPFYLLENIFMIVIANHLPTATTIKAVEVARISRTVMVSMSRGDTGASPSLPSLGRR
jgi:hypothetical protein